MFCLFCGERGRGYTHGAPTLLSLSMVVAVLSMVVVAFLVVQLYFRIAWSVHISGTIAVVSNDSGTRANNRSSCLKKHVQVVIGRCQHDGPPAVWHERLPAHQLALCPPFVHSPFVSRICGLEILVRKLSGQVVHQQRQVRGGGVACSERIQRNPRWRAAI